jgi:hypothetical protein
VVVAQEVRYAPIPQALTEKPSLPAAPAPAGLQGQYSHQQLTDMLSTALSIIRTLYDRLDAIAEKSNQAVSSNPQPKDHP